MASGDLRLTLHLPLCSPLKGVSALERRFPTCAVVGNLASGKGLLGNLNGRSYLRYRGGFDLYQQFGKRQACYAHQRAGGLAASFP